MGPISATGGKNSADGGDSSAAVGRNEGITFGSRTQATDGSEAGMIFGTNTLMLIGVGLVVFLIFKKKGR